MLGLLAIAGPLFYDNGTQMSQEDQNKVMLDFAYEIYELQDDFSSDLIEVAVGS